MKHIKLLTTDHITIEYNAIDDYIYADWHGALTNEVIMEGYEKILFFLAKEHCHKLLDNHYHVQGLWADLAEWCAYDWNPRSVAAGLQYHAVVYSKDYFSMLSTDKAIRLAKSGIMKGFDSLQDAENWLKFM
ncbi:hypothetical protein [Pontibacter burrus]|uniref:STAS/SEC14 domain-containing protein n=1 Tax=Pontibacter burrus TaxID=2704466 RepID=A0A6B3LRJ1_9BACT|nr:hypothetical protein [Pontibacter burrus]NEM96114.1 hypothetical protein [Pontibacter burrus]